MADQKLLFDMDGTITDGRYLSVEDRELHDYYALPTYDDITRDVWNKLQDQYDCYIVTARSMPRARQGVEEWLEKEFMDWPAGIIVGIEPHVRPYLYHDLQASALFDDNPAVPLDPWGNFYLMNNPYWEANQKVEASLKIHNWKEIGDLLLK